MYSWKKLAGISSIPEELYHDILLKLPVKSLLRCKCVCKSWYALISNPSFVMSHLNLQKGNRRLILNGNTIIRNCNLSLYSIDHDFIPSLLSSTDDFTQYAVELDYPFKISASVVRLIGCCDGLVCLSFNDTAPESFCLWNPATKDYKVLPKSSNMNNTHAKYFGYDSKSEDYNLIVWYDSVVQVYSLKLNSWKVIDINMPHLLHTYTQDNPGVLFNGDPHWISYRQDHHNMHMIVVSLDISNEKFKEIELPKKVVGIKADVILVVLQGCLCVLSDYDMNDYIDVWVMQEYGVQESWTKRFVINHASQYVGRMRLVSFSKSGEILIERDHEHLYYYDHKQGIARKPYTRSLSEWRRVEDYFESLVSLSGGSYVRKKKD